MTRCTQSRTERGEPPDKGNIINGISHRAKATDILRKKLTVGCSVGQNENEAFEGKSWLQGVVGRGAHIPPGEFVFVSGKKNHLSFFPFNNCRGGTRRFCNASHESRPLQAFAG